MCLNRDTGGEEENGLSAGGHADGRTSSIWRANSDSASPRCTMASKYPAMCPACSAAAPDTCSHTLGRSSAGMPCAEPL